jgi:hypothetical protein
MTAAAIAALVSVQAVAQNERELLAPTSRLRVGVYLGSPLSMVHDPATGEARGLSVDLGKALANRLGVPVAIVPNSPFAMSGFIMPMRAIMVGLFFWATRIRHSIAAYHSPRFCSALGSFMM